MGKSKKTIRGVLRPLARTCAFALSHLLGVNRWCRKAHRGELLIVCYHGICDDSVVLNQESGRMNIHRRTFGWQLEFFRNAGYQFISLSEGVSRLAAGRPLPEHAVTLTFDDGRRNVVRNAYPLMQQYGAKGCFFVVSELVGTDHLLWTDWIVPTLRRSTIERLDLDVQGEKISLDLTAGPAREANIQRAKVALSKMDYRHREQWLDRLGPAYLPAGEPELRLAGWDELAALDSQVMEIGSHSATHPNLTTIASDADLDYEIRGSKETIEGKLGRAVNHFCYPGGAYNDSVLAKIAECGYASASAVDYGFNGAGADLRRLLRVAVAEPSLAFRGRVSGLPILLAHGRRVISSPGGKTAGAARAAATGSVAAVAGDQGRRL